MKGNQLERLVRETQILDNLPKETVLLERKGAKNKNLDAKSRCDKRFRSNGLANEQIKIN